MVLYMSSDCTSCKRLLQSILLWTHALLVLRVAVPLVAYLILCPQHHNHLYLQPRAAAAQHNNNMLHHVQVRGVSTDGPCELLLL